MVHIIRGFLYVCVFRRCKDENITQTRRRLVLSYKNSKISVLRTYCCMMILGFLSARIQVLGTKTLLLLVYYITCIHVHHSLHCSFFIFIFLILNLRVCSYGKFRWSKCVNVLWNPWEFLSKFSSIQEIVLQWCCLLQIFDLVLVCEHIIMYSEAHSLPCDPVNEGENPSLINLDPSKHFEVNKTIISLKILTLVMCLCCNFGC